MKTTDTITRRIPTEAIIGAKTGLEKEGLRVRRDGQLSDKIHPTVLGSALTHPSITTDFSESLLELITPPSHRGEDALAYLAETEAFVHQHLADELVWSASMPCHIDDADDIPIAHYGHSDTGMSKHIYRRGLAHRYGKMMQVIAGVHFNFSFSEDLWPELQSISGDRGALRSFTDDSYMRTLRNVQRYDWLLLYLFGASPAVDRSFVGAVDRLKPFDRETYHAPYATSLRMGDMGYTNSVQAGNHIRIDYNSLDGYLAALRKILDTSHPAYEEIGLIVDGAHRQLNTHLLQIENEFYSSVRPKQIARDGESPHEALGQRGIRYLELRSIDINPFVPSGVEVTQLHFLETFIHFCLFSDSPLYETDSSDINRKNLNLTAYLGRSPDLKLSRDGEKVRMQVWADQLFDQMQPVAELLDNTHDTDRYTIALKHYWRYLQEPELTPSATLLREMREQGSGFTDYILQQSVAHHSRFLSNCLNPARLEYYEALSRQSLRQQCHMECRSQGVFDEDDAKHADNSPCVVTPCVCASSYC
ncbi:MAG: glutamate--cysteine ligase [Candidatus Thiodiazotropha sp. (ex Monitilora ramsayi)]|nr:glutamate--cysteine ligase [Candidatus Thiodiazotropha sp. (ex Monitilora ramsayi)]